ncbi:MAG TPA: glycosyltransferase, partial [Solirubrobacterales bacterium]|nr:glycosyltransferase [Solirubrobacterales bacterium]
MELSSTEVPEPAPPAARVRAVVVVPARDEEARIGACLEALADQVEVDPEEYEIIVVLDACEDATAAVVQAARAQGVDGP